MSREQGERHTRNKGETKGDKGKGQREGPGAVHMMDRCRGETMGTGDAREAW